MFCFQPLPPGLSGAAFKNRIAISFNRPPRRHIFHIFDKFIKFVIYFHIF